MSWLKKLKSGLAKSSSKLTENITSVITKKKLDQDTLDDLEDALIMSDLGTNTASKIVSNFSKNRFGKEVDIDEIKATMASEIENILAPVAQPIKINEENKPHVIMMVGVNGNGKTTTLGKIAQQQKLLGKKIVIAACDTFRAAAVEQLAVWGERSGCKVIKGSPQADPASVAYTALEYATKENADILLIDTAGRLQNKKGLMEELAKISRVIKKIDENAPHDTILVLDATTGQNAHSQIESFKEIANVSGMIVTKLDGTAKGGVVVALAEKFSTPIHAIGVGESIEDLQTFEAKEFAKNLMGIN